ncbi:nucleoside phosphorylase domain-containing protein [Aspergillus cavernicola]|uniref:Nucleoside phosphorylase domain-containing protein n=1 Tax=Aspergillus cavernicola TaxID=176166 RepID=A0ABR4HEC1_9EURO
MSTRTHDNVDIDSEVDPRKKRKLNRKLSHDDYTIGWMCVLRCELNATRALLDEEHARLPPAENDNNSYVLGQMGLHNIAIAFSGSGIYGTNAAAQTTTNMLRTFRNIRFGLLVGVGGGAPMPPDPSNSLCDIRLGDVVVCNPKGNHGGVLHYDFGKWGDDRAFSVESHLNKPPKILSKAIELLQSDHDFGQGEMKQYVSQITEISKKRPALREYRFPARGQDQLFKAHIPHSGGEDCLKSDEPVVHYGLIASGNAVMRSARYRDRLRDMWNISCFEMEAAALVDDFPCAVIRGICDYSDGHKTKLWQPYAAVVAAAYAKDLLREVTDTLSNINEILAIVSKTTEQAQKAEILTWLTPITHGSEQSDIFTRATKGTGQWFLSSAEFHSWLSQAKQILFCQGIPGAGKTIMASIVVNHLQTVYQIRHRTEIAYVYCNFRRHSEQKPTDILANLLKQLVGRGPSLPKSMEVLYTRHKEIRTRPSLDEICRVLRSVVADYEKVYIVIDALDESQKSALLQKMWADIWTTI